MNLTDITPTEGLDILAFLKDHYGPQGYDFEMRNGEIWERNRGGPWYRQFSTFDWWRQTLDFQDWVARR